MKQPHKQSVGVDYFAYGSNMDLPYLQRWLARYGVDPRGVTVARHAILPGFRFRVNYLTATSAGAANVQPCRGKCVEGVLLSVTPGVVNALRAKEGYPTRYEEIDIEVIVPGTGQTVKAITYRVSREYRLYCDMPVSGRYLRRVLNGAESIPLSQDYQAELRSILKEADSLALFQRALLTDGSVEAFRRLAWMNWCDSRPSHRRMN